MSWGAYSSVPPIVEAILSTDDLRLSSLALMAAIASALLVTEACAASKLSLPIIVRIFSSDLRRRTELGVGWSSIGIGSRRLGVGVRREGLAHRQQSVSAGFAQLSFVKPCFGFKLGIGIAAWIVISFVIARSIGHGSMCAQLLTHTCLGASRV